MAEVKCTAIYAISLPDGRLLRPGVHAKNVDLDDPEIKTHLASSGLVVIDKAADADVPDGKIADVIDWVGDDVDRAQLALTAEGGKEHPRSTLLEHLEQLVADNTTEKE